MPPWRKYRPKWLREHFDLSFWSPEAILNDSQLSQMSREPTDLEWWRKGKGVNCKLGLAAAGVGLPSSLLESWTRNIQKRVMFLRDKK